MEHNQLIQLLNNETGIVFPDKISLEELKKIVAQHIDHLIKNNFEKLVALLYRIDISEIHLKNLLKQNMGEDAAPIIAQLIIERQLEKIKSRQQFSRDGNDIPEEDKW
jgi:hypothetical protein